MKKVEVITDHQLKRNRSLIYKALEQFKGKDVIITIDRLKKKRSNPQNRYYWGLILPLVRDGLYDLNGELQSIQEVHEFLKFNFNYKEIVNEESGEVYRQSRSSADNSTIEMEEYHDRIRKFASEFLNVEIPLPNEDLTIF